jgi:argininosuccinate lyase
MRAAAERGFITATDLADWLVRKLAMPFRQAHHVTGTIVRLAEQKGCRLAELDLAAMQDVEPRIDASVFDVLDVERSVASRTSLGGTAPDNVRRAVAAVREKLR